MAVLKIKSLGIDKALQCDSSFTQALAQANSYLPKRKPMALKGGIGSRALSEQEIEDIRERKRKAAADRAVQQTMLNAGLAKYKQTKLGNKVLVRTRDGKHVFQTTPPKS